MEPKLLQQGDIIYDDNRGILTKHIIDRVTNNYAMVGEKKFHREITKSGVVRRVGKTDHWDFSVFVYGNEEINAKYELQEAYRITRNKFNDATAAKRLELSHLKIIRDVLDLPRDFDSLDIEKFIRTLDEYSKP